MRLDQAVEAERTGQVGHEVYLIACTLCGTILWDVEKHYIFYHPRVFGEGWDEQVQET